jgi:toxin-antitoxin system PIN domain toxin
MNTLNFLDTNVWLALLWRRHSHSAVARQWFDGLEDETFLFCRFTQIAVLRLLTTEKVMGGDVKRMAEAWDLWDEIWADPRTLFVPEPESLEGEFRRRSKLSSSSPKVWADGYLLAFASVAGLKLVTFDRALLNRGVEVLML